MTKLLSIRSVERHNNYWIFSLYAKKILLAPLRSAARFKKKTNEKPKYNEKESQ